NSLNKGAAIEAQVAGEGHRDVPWLLLAKIVYTDRSRLYRMSEQGQVVRGDLDPAANTSNRPRLYIKNATVQKDITMRRAYGEGARVSNTPSRLSGHN